MRNKSLLRIRLAAYAVLAGLTTICSTSCLGADGDVLAFWKFGSNYLASSVGRGLLLAGEGAKVTDGYVHFDGGTAAWLKTSTAIDLSSKSAVTFDFWVRPTKYGSILYEFWPDINTAPSLSCSYTAAPLRAYFNGSGKVCKLEGPESIHSDGNWHHVAVVYQKTDYPACVTLYVDGVNVGKSTTDAGPLTALPNAILYIGCRRLESYNLTGDLDAFRITEGAVSAANVAAMYEAAEGREDDDAVLGAEYYVTNGLIALFDARENVSWGGAHDATATVWRNIAPNPPANAPVALTLGEGAQWSEACALTTDGTGAAAALEGAFADFTTVEVASRLNDFTQYCGIFECGDGSKRLFAGTSAITLRGSENRISSSLLSSELAKPNTFSLSVSDSDVSFAINGVACALDVIPGNIYAGTRFSVGARYCEAAAPYPAKGSFECVRLYDRKLTAAEIRRNRFIDQIRYHGGVLPSTWRTDKEGRIECLVEVQADEGGRVRIGDGEWATQVSGWHLLGSVVTVAAEPSSDRVFFEWKGETVTGLSGSFEVASPVSLKAVFRRPFTHRWAGPNGGDFAKAVNWRDTHGEVCAEPPGPTSVAWIPRADSTGESSSVTVTGAVEIAGLTFGDGVGAGSAELTFMRGETMTVTGNVNIVSGTILCDYLSKIMLRIGGDMSVGSAATITALGRGYGNGGSGSCLTGCTHGGVKGTLTEATSTTPVYGDALHPVDFGSGSSYYRGGGVIRLEVAGTLFLDGLLTASGAGSIGDRVSYSGAGGSVWVTTGAIAGGGEIHADGGYFSSSYGGSGGRIAIWLTRPESDFASFSGFLSAAGGGFSSADGAPYSGHGTICRGFANGTNELILQNVRGNVSATAVRGYTTLPSGTTSCRKTAVRLGKYGVLKLTDDLQVADVDLLDATSAICLQGHKLRIYSKNHQDTWKGTVVADGGTIKWGLPCGTFVVVK